MSIVMFIVDPVGDDEKKFNVPVLTEAMFEKIVLPVAELIGADLVSIFSIGLEVDSANADRLENELKILLKSLPITTEVREYIHPRFENLIRELREVFARKHCIKLYIG